MPIIVCVPIPQTCLQRSRSGRLLEQTFLFEEPEKDAFLAAQHSGVFADFFVELSLRFVDGDAAEVGFEDRRMDVALSAD